MTALHACADVRALVPGDVQGVQSLADAYSATALGAGRASMSAGRVRTGSWQGEASRSFAVQVDALPVPYVRASRVLRDTAAALSAWAEELERARATARRAVELMVQAEHRTTVWQRERAAHLVAVHDRQSALLASAASFSLAPVAPLGPAPPLRDPGEELRESAHRLLEGARRHLEDVGRQVASRLTAAAAEAPDGPGFLARLADGGAAVRRAAVSFGEGFGESVAETASAIWAGAPVRALWDADGVLEHYEQLGAGMVYAVRNPGDAAAAALDLETWRTDPARALGHLGPDALLAAVTAGGTAAVTGARRTVDAADDLADAADRADGPGAPPVGPGTQGRPEDRGQEDDARGSIKADAVEVRAGVIARGHAWAKHVMEGGEFPWIGSKEAFADYLARGMADPDLAAHLGPNRTVYWWRDDEHDTDVFVVDNRATGTEGSAYAAKRDYFFRQITKWEGPGGITDWLRR